MKKFHIKDVLAVITGKLPAGRHIGGVYDILNYMIDDNIYTHQLPEAMELCAPEIKEQIPEINNPSKLGDYVLVRPII